MKKYFAEWIRVTYICANKKGTHNFFTLNNFQHG